MINCKTLDITGVPFLLIYKNSKKMSKIYKKITKIYKIDAYNKKVAGVFFIAKKYEEALGIEFNN